LDSNFQDHIKKLADKLECSYEDALNEIKLFYDGLVGRGKKKSITHFRLYFV